MKTDVSSFDFFWVSEDGSLNQTLKHWNITFQTKNHGMIVAFTINKHILGEKCFIF